MTHCVFSIWLFTIFPQQNWAAVAWRVDRSNQNILRCPAWSRRRGTTGHLKHAAHLPAALCVPLQQLDIDWESALCCDDFLPESGLVVPEFPSPLTEQDIRHLQAVVDPTGPSSSHGRDVYCLQIFQWTTIMLVRLYINYCAVYIQIHEQSKFIEFNKHHFIKISCVLPRLNVVKCMFCSSVAVFLLHTANN